MEDNTELREKLNTVAKLETEHNIKGIGGMLPKTPGTVLLTEDLIDYTIEIAEETGRLLKMYENDEITPR